MSKPCGGCSATSVGIGGSCWHNIARSNTLSIAACGVIIGPLSPSVYNRRGPNLVPFPDPQQDPHCVHRVWE